MFGPSLIASHASASLSGTGLTVGIISGGDTLSGLFAKTLGVVGRGTGKGTAITPSSDVELSVLGGKGCIDVDSDGLERSAVDDFFVLQKRSIVSIGSLACRCWRNLFESSEALTPAS